MKHLLRSVTAFNCLVVAGGILTDAAIAQQTAADTGQLEDIVVTAQKRESTIETTPISLTAVSGADITARGITDLSSLMQSVPGVSMRTSGPGMTEFEMRGVASNGGNSPTVGFYFDETPLTAPAAANEGKIVISPDLYDLDRVEVLRGPQGTLYGAGSMGGTIRVIPKAPNTDAFEASGEVKFDDSDHGGFGNGENAMVNLPLGGGIAAVRIVGTYSYDPGWIDRVVIAPGQFPLPTGIVNSPTGPYATVRGNVLAAPVAEDYPDVNDVEKTAVRISAVIKPFEGLTITPSYLYQKLRSGGLPYIDSTPGTDAHYQPFDISEAYTDEFHLTALNIKYHTDAYEISSSTAYWTRHEPLVQDASESWTTAFFPPGYVSSYGPGNGGLGAAEAQEDNQSHQTTEELRIASVGDSKLKWLAGYFYSDFESGWNIVFPSQTGAAIFGSNNLFDYYSPFKIFQQSEFGEVTYNITEPFAVTVGARHYYYSAPVGLDQYGAVTTAVTSETSERDQGFTPKVSLSYQFDKDLLLYATAAKGFRPGGGTGPVPTSGPSTCETQLAQEYGSKGFVNGPISFTSDSVWSYELGEKWRSADGRFSVNASGYFESWIGVQQVNSLSSCGYVYTANVGDAHVYGSEIEAKAIVLNDLTASASVTYAHAALVSSTLIGAGFNPGTPIQEVPRWSGSVQLSYHHELNEKLSLIGRAESNYTGNRTDETFYTNELPPYDLTNLRGGLQGDRWSAVLFVNNVADKRALLNNVTEAAENLATYNRVAVSQPRTAGFDLSYKFK